MRWTVALFVLLVAACSGGGPSDPSPKRTNETSSTVPLRAAVGDLYQPPAHMRSAAPGTLIWARAFAQSVTEPVTKQATNIWLMLYHSRDRRGHDIAVSGFAIVPRAPSPAGGRPVYAWAHALTGLGDSCAPSKTLRRNIPPYGIPQLRRGAVVVATDYEGLGTPGDYPYLVGAAEARGVLDSVRAAASLPNVGDIGAVVIAGESEGANAALWAAQSARKYAPELHIGGVVALSPAGDLPARISSIDKTPARLGDALMMAGGLQAGSADFDPAAFLTPEAVDDLPRVRRECAPATIARYRTRPSNSVVRRDPDADRATHALLVENSPGATDPHVPILILQGARDADTPAAATRRLRAKYCSLHATVSEVVYPGANHDGAIKAAQHDALRWIADRYRNRQVRPTCT